MQRSRFIATILALSLAGVGLWFFTKGDNPTATVPATSTSVSAAPADALTKTRLDEIAAIINKDEPKSAKLASQASTIVPSLRSSFLELNTPISDITFKDDIVVTDRSATVTSTGAAGTVYTAHLAYVADPAANGKYQWLILYTEPK